MLPSKTITNIFLQILLNVNFFNDTRFSFYNYFSNHKTQKRITMNYTIRQKETEQ